VVLARLVANALAAAGHNGVVFDNLLFGHREFVCWGPLIEGDIRDASVLDAVFSECGLMR
jgi:UDP-glucose 4-epimerase